MNQGETSEITAPPVYVVRRISAGRHAVLRRHESVYHDFADCAREYDAQAIAAAMHAGTQ